MNVVVVVVVVFINFHVVSMQRHRREMRRRVARPFATVKALVHEKIGLDHQVNVCVCVHGDKGMFQHMYIRTYVGIHTYVCKCLCIELTCTPTPSSILTYVYPGSSAMNLS